MTPFTFEVPGQPPSVNHMYVRVRGRWDRQTKAPGIEQYQQDVVYLCRASKPAGWTVPEGYIRLCYTFHLRRDADCDNLLKVLNDAIAMALNVNDRMFLPCVVDKTVGSKTPRTIIEVRSPLRSRDLVTSAQLDWRDSSPKNSLHSRPAP
jgi:Holliday junction resolvase RusA-like endonuclease